MKAETLLAEVLRSLAEWLEAEQQARETGEPLPDQDMHDRLNEYIEEAVRRAGQ